MKVLKVLLAVVATIAVLMVLGAVLLVAFFDPNDYKGHVTGWVEQRTGRSFAIDGDLELAFFPWLAIETEGVTLGNPEGFEGPEPFARIERIAAGVRLMPLLERRVEIGSVRLDGVRLNLERAPDGRGNWEDFDAAPSAPADDGATDTSSLLENLDIASIEIHDGEVRWHEHGGVRYVLSGIRLATGSIRAGEPIDAALAVRVFDVESERTFDVDGASLIALAALDATVGDTAVALERFRLGLRVYDDTLSELVSGQLDAASFHATQDGRVEIGPARVAGRLAEVPAAPQGLSFGAELTSARFDPTVGDFAAQDLVTQVAGVAAHWQLDVRNVIHAPEIAGTVAVENAAIAELLNAFNVSMPASIDAAAIGTLDAAAQFRAALSLHDGLGGDAPAVGPYRLDALAVEDVELALLGVSVRGNAALGDNGVIGATLEVPPFVPSDALRSIAAAEVPQELDLSAIDRLSLSARAELDPASGRLALRDVELAALDAQLRASLDVVPGADGAGAMLEGTISTSPIEAEQLASLLAAAWPKNLEPAQLEAVSLESRFAYDGTAQRVNLDEVSLRGFGLSATGRVSITGLDAAPNASGELRIAELSPREVLQRFAQPEPATSDPKALTRASLSARFDASSRAVRVAAADLVLDDSRITGDFAVDGLDAAAPTYRFALTIDGIDVDRYLPPQAGDTPDGGAETQTAGDIELPVDALRNLNIDGRVQVGKLRLAGLDFADVATGIAVGSGRASLSPARARLYGGEFEGSFDVDTTNEPGLRLRGRATALRLEPLITALTGDANFSGIGDFDLDLAGRGATVIENVENTNGSVAFSMRDGAIDGFNLGRGLCVVYNATQRLSQPAAQPDVTEYALIRGTASVSGGVASSSDLLARASFMDLTGRGTLSLVEQRLNYSLEAKLTGSTGIPGCEAMDDLIGESLPLTLRGTVTNPEILPDFSEIIERRLRDAVRDRVQDRLQDRLRDLLR